MGSHIEAGSDLPNTSCFISANPLENKLHMADNEQHISIMLLVTENFFFHLMLHRTTGCQYKSTTTEVSASATLLIKIKSTWYTFNIFVVLIYAHCIYSIIFYAYIVEIS